MKKADEGREGQTKARGSTIPKFYNFFMSMGLLSVTSSHIFIFLSFKAQARQKVLKVGGAIALELAKSWGG